MIFWYININWAPLELLKPSPFRLVFQQLPRGQADVNAEKIMFDPYIVWKSNDKVNLRN